MLLFFSEAALFLFASFYVFIAELNQLVDIKIAFVFFSMIFLAYIGVTEHVIALNGTLVAESGTGTEGGARFI